MPLVASRYCSSAGAIDNKLRWLMLFRFMVHKERTRLPDIGGDERLPLESNTQAYRSTLIEGLEQQCCSHTAKILVHKTMRLDVLKTSGALFVCVYVGVSR